MRNAETILGIIRERGSKGLVLEDVYGEWYPQDLRDMAKAKTA